MKLCIFYLFTFLAEVHLKRRSWKEEGSARLHALSDQSSVVSVRGDRTVLSHFPLANQDNPTSDTSIINSRYIFHSTLVFYFT